MRVELFPFQQKAVNDLRTRAAAALGMYRSTHIPQVLSLQAPTGAGKTIIMAALIEDIYFGTEDYVEQPEAIFVWLSDSPALNEQSRQKIDLKADKIKFGQCVTIEDESFDMEELQDGHIYFLNTQKLGKAGNLGHHSDTRQYTIWETLENTARNKADRLYFIIDEAHRGMQGRAAGTATSIMQRFIKGSPAHKLSPMPVVVGMSATSARFNQLVGDTSSTLQKVTISPSEVRASGLLKDRILITYPEDSTKHDPMAVLQAAAAEWKKKCEHWRLYSYEQHYAQVNPVFLIQVQPGTSQAVSKTNLDDVIANIEAHTGWTFKENEVIHTFGSTGVLEINGLKVPHVEPEEITEDKRIRVVLFKENLSTGWDCPRAETMMSFRHAEDATYIAQLLGRMIRTPLQCHILVDDYLNDVRLYLPYFDRDTVKNVVDELQNAEGGELPVVVDSEALENQVYVPWTIYASRRQHTDNVQMPGQVSLSELDISVISENAVSEQPSETLDAPRAATPLRHDVPGEGFEKHTQAKTLPAISVPDQTAQENAESVGEQLTVLPGIDREAVTRFINSQGFLTYVVRTAKIHSYLKSLLDLTVLLTKEAIYMKANSEVRADVVGMIRAYVEQLHESGQYDTLAAKVLQFRLLVDVFDVFGESIRTHDQIEFYTTSNIDLDRQLRAADARMGNYGFPNLYGQKYFDADSPSTYAIDCILFAADDSCIAALHKYAEKKFHELNDTHRRYLVGKSEKCRKQYDDIVANSDIITKHNFMLPETVHVRVDVDGEKYDNHLFVGPDGLAQIRLNGWEAGLIAEETRQPGFVCWLRNPPREKWSLCIPYEMGGEMKAAYPDFIIVRRDDVLEYVIDILEPHNPAFKDNLGKAKGLAKYAQEEPRVGRIQLIRMEKDAVGNHRFKRLDMTKGLVRRKVIQAISNEELDHIFDIDGIF